MTTEKVFVVEITPVVADDGSTQTFLFGTAAFATKPTDTPANTSVRPLLKNPGSLRRELFSGARVTGAIRPSYGNIVLANPAPDADSAGELDAWFDYGLSGSKVVVRYGTIGDAYPSAWTTVYIAYAQSFVADLNEITIRLRDRLQLLEQPVVTDGFAGTGGLEGTGGISKRKQFVSQGPGFFPPILVDVNRQIYFVQSTGDGGLGRYSIGLLNTFQVFDNGINITRQTPNYSSEAEILNSSPSQGFARFYFGTPSKYAGNWNNGPVYFRLGSPPAGDLRVFGSGYTNDEDSDRWGSPLGGPYRAEVLALRAGLQKSDLYNNSQFITPGEILVDDDSSYNDILSDGSLTYQGWYGFTRLDKFRSGPFNDPENDYYYYGITPGLTGQTQSFPTTSKFEFNTSNVQGLRREPVNGMEAPIWKISVRAGKTWPSQIANGATPEIKDYFSREIHTSFQGVSTETLLKNPGAISAELEIRGRNFPNQFSVRLWLERYFVLYGGRRDFFTFTTPMTEEVLDLELTDVVTLKTPRFGLSAGKKFRIVGIEIQAAGSRGPTMKFTLWGGEIGRFTGYTGGPGSVSYRPPNQTPSVVNPLLLQELMGNFTGDFFGSVITPSASTAGSEASYMGDFYGDFLGTVKTVDPFFTNVLALAHGQDSDWETVFYAPLTSNDDDTIYPIQLGTPQDAGALSFSSSGVTITNDATENQIQYSGAFKTSANTLDSKLKISVYISTNTSTATTSGSPNAIFSIGAGARIFSIRYNASAGVVTLYARYSNEGSGYDYGTFPNSAFYEITLNEVNRNDVKFYLDNVLKRSATTEITNNDWIGIGPVNGSKAGINNFTYKDLTVKRLQSSNSGPYSGSPGRKAQIFLTGDASVSTEQSKFGTKAFKINNTNSSGVVVDEDGGFNFSNGNFTIEFWAYRNTQTGTPRYLVETKFGTIRLTFNGTTGNLVTCYIATSTATRSLTVTSVAFAANQWVHFAMQRNGTRFELFVDGVSVAANTSLTSGETCNPSSYLLFGRPSDTDLETLNGYMQDIRITKAARYTAGNFTPPTAAFPDE